jgi:hypothetical protein
MPDAAYPMSDAEERSVLERAYLPEHVPGLMAILARGTPRLVDDHLVVVGEEALIVVGYPLDRAFSVERCEAVIRETVDAHRPRELRFLGPELPPSLRGDDVARESDVYLDLATDAIPDRLARIAARAREALTIAHGRAFGPDHEALAVEVSGRTPLPPPVASLYAAMPRCVATSRTAEVLSAHDRDGRLQAFFVVERGARSFDAYLLGAHTKERPVPHASDALFDEMIRGAREAGKPSIALGRAVNPGIRRFKEKWGGVETVAYEAAERRLRRPGLLSLLRMLRGGDS